MKRMTIFTIHLNDLTGLKKTIDSVEQQGADVTHVIIDGCSTDGTIDYLATHRSSLTEFRFYSAPDTGIYDAFNKSLDLVHTDYFMLLNAGDTFIDRHQLTLLKSIIFSRPEIDVFCTGVNFVDKNSVVRRTWVPDQAYPNAAVRAGRLPPHPGLVYKSNVVGVCRYDDSFRISGDTDYLIRLFMRQVKTLSLSKITINMQTGGISTNLKHLLRKEIEDFIIIFKYGLNPFMFIFNKKIRKLRQRRGYK